MAIFTDFKSNKRETKKNLSTLRKVEGVKAASYAHVLDGARSAAAVSAGLRVIIYTTCSFTSLGALGTGTVKCLNAAAATSRSMRWLLLAQPLGMMVSPPETFCTVSVPRPL